MSERKLQQEQFMQPGFGYLTSRYSSSNLVREQPVGQENYLAGRSLQPVAILPKVLLSFTLQQKTSPLPPSQPTLYNRLQLGQGICSPSCFPGCWERVTLPKGMVNHLCWWKASPRPSILCFEQSFVTGNIFEVTGRKHMVWEGDGTQPAVPWLWPWAPVVHSKSANVAGPQVLLHRQDGTSPGHWGAA